MNYNLQYELLVLNVIKKDNLNYLLLLDTINRDFKSFTRFNFKNVEIDFFFKYFYH